MKETIRRIKETNPVGHLYALWSIGWRYCIHNDKIYKIVFDNTGPTLRDGDEIITVPFDMVIHPISRRTITRLGGRKQINRALI